MATQDEKKQSAPLTIPEMLTDLAEWNADKTKALRKGLELSEDGDLDQDVADRIVNYVFILDGASELVEQFNDVIKITLIDHGYDLGKVEKVAAEKQAERFQEDMTAGVLNALDLLTDDTPWSDDKIRSLQELLLIPQGDITGILDQRTTDKIETALLEHGAVGIVDRLHDDVKEALENNGKILNSLRIDVNVAAISREMPKGQSLDTNQEDAIYVLTLMGLLNKETTLSNTFNATDKEISPSLQVGMQSFYNAHLAGKYPKALADMNSGEFLTEAKRIFEARFVAVADLENHNMDEQLTLRYDPMHIYNQVPGMAYKSPSVIKAKLTGTRPSLVVDGARAASRKLGDTVFWHPGVDHNASRAASDAERKAGYAERPAVAKANKSGQAAENALQEMNEVSAKLADANGKLNGKYVRKGKAAQTAINEALSGLNKAIAAEQKLVAAGEKAITEAENYARNLAEAPERQAILADMEARAAEIKDLEADLEQRQKGLEKKGADKKALRKEITDIKIDIKNLNASQANAQTKLNLHERDLRNAVVEFERAREPYIKAQNTLSDLETRKAYFTNAQAKVNTAIADVNNPKAVTFDEAPKMGQADARYRFEDARAKAQDAKTKLEQEKAKLEELKNEPRPPKAAADAGEEAVEAAQAARKEHADRLRAARQAHREAHFANVAAQKELAQARANYTPDYPAEIRNAATDLDAAKARNRVAQENLVSLKDAADKPSTPEPKPLEERQIKLREAQERLKNARFYNMHAQKELELAKAGVEATKGPVVNIDELEADLKSAQRNAKSANTRLGNANRNLNNFDTQIERHRASQAKNVQPKAEVRAALEKKLASAQRGVTKWTEQVALLESQIEIARGNPVSAEARAAAQERLATAERAIQESSNEVKLANRAVKDAKFDLGKPAPAPTSTRAAATPEQITEAERVAAQAAKDVESAQKRLDDLQVEARPTDGATRHSATTKTAWNDLTKKGKLIRVANNVGTGTAKFGNLLLDAPRGLWNGAGKILRVGGRALPLIGAGIATYEVSGLGEKVYAAQQAGLISGTTSAALAAEYGAHIAQSGFDITLFGGEAITENAMDGIRKASGMDRALAMVLSPDFMSNIVFGEEEFSKRELAQMKARYSMENIIGTYNEVIANINKANNAVIPDTVKLHGPNGDERIVSFGVAVRDPEITKEVVEQLLEDGHDIEVIQKAINGTRLITEAARLAQQALYDNDYEYRREMNRDIQHVLHQKAKNTTLGSDGTLDRREMESVRNQVIIMTKSGSLERALYMMSMYDAIAALPDDSETRLEADADEVGDFMKAYKDADMLAVAKTVAAYSKVPEVERETFIEQWLLKSAEEQKAIIDRMVFEKNNPEIVAAEKKAQEEETRKKMEEEQRQREAAKAEASSKKKPDATVVSSDSTTNDQTSSAEADSAPCDNKVLETQALLRLIGQYNGPIDGIVTPETAKAIKAYAATQKDLPDNSSIDRVHNELKYRLYTDPDFQKTVVLGVLGAFEKKPMDREDIKAAQVAMNIGGAKGLDGKALDITGKPCKDTINALSEYTEATQPVIEKAPVPVVQNDAPAAQNDNVVSGDTCKQKFNGVAEHYGAVIWEKAQSTKEPIHFHVPQYMKDKVQVNGSGATAVNTVEMTDGIAVMDWREKDEHWQLEIGRAENAGRNGVLDMYPDGRLSITVLADDADDVQGLTKKWVRRDFTEYLSENPAFVNMLDEVPFFDKTEAHDHMALAYDAAKETLGDKFDPKAGIALYISLNGDGQYRVRVFEDCGKMQIRMIADDKNCDPAVTKAIAQTPKELQKVHKPSDFTAENLKKTFPNYKTPEERVEEARVAAAQAEQEALASRSCYARDELSPLQKAACQKNEEIPGHSSNVGYPGAGKKI